MKKAGSSNSKSKIRRTSKSTAPRTSQETEPKAEAAAFASALSVGHRPAQQLSPQDAELFRAFQSNLLSLISHELRTPLTSILNALNLLEEGVPGGEFSGPELIRMARKNAERLHQALLSLLDLAALESGNFHARLREVDLVKLVRSRCESHAALLKDRGIVLRETTEQSERRTPLLADPQRLGRAIELCLQVLIPRAQGGSELKIRISSSAVALTFRLGEGLEPLWESAWSQALAGYEGGVASPSSAFAGVLQSEQAFLTRLEEGLGSELMLIHELMRLHQGKLTQARAGKEVTLKLELPELSSEDGLRAVLNSRAYQISSELGSVTLVLVRVPQEFDLGAFRNEMARYLFRTTDAAYALPAMGIVALVLDDCKPEDAPRLIARIEKAFGQKLGHGIAHCPSDGLDPGALLELAQGRMERR